MPNFRRTRVPGGTYFFTVNLQERQRKLLVEHIQVLRTAFRSARATRPFKIVAICVMPDHLHCIWRLPPHDFDNASRWRHIKTLFSRQLPAGGRQRVATAQRIENGVWQRRYWQHLIRNQRDLARHVDYVHSNPVKHRLVQCAADWPWSSFHRYVRAGILPSNWGTDT